MKSIEEGRSRTRIRRFGGEPERRTTAGTTQGCSLEQKCSKLQLGAELPVTDTNKRGGKRTVNAQKRPNHSLHPPRSFWSMCLQLKKRMEEMEKALVISVNQAQRQF